MFKSHSEAIGREASQHVCKEAKNMCPVPNRRAAMCQYIAPSNQLSMTSERNLSGAFTDEARNIAWDCGDFRDHCSYTPLFDGKSPAI